MLYEPPTDAVVIDRVFPFPWPEQTARETPAHAGAAERTETTPTGDEWAAGPLPANDSHAPPALIPSTSAPCPALAAAERPTPEIPEVPEMIEASEIPSVEAIPARAALADETLDDAVRMWLREVGRTPLLTFQEEIVLARRIESGDRSAATLRDERNTFTEEQRSILQRIVEQGQRSKERLIGANLRLVVAVAKRYMGRGLTFGDLVQEGNIGLLRAVEKYEYRRGYKFSTYATWWIRQSITRAIADQGRTIRVPVHMVEAMSRVVRAQSRLAQDLGREATLEEVASEMGIPVDRVREAVDVIPEPLSLEMPVGDEDAHLSDFLEDTTSASPMESVSQNALRDQIDALLRDALTERERQVVALRYGLGDGVARTLEEVGAAVGVTRERIRQLEIRALKKLRHPSRAGRLRDILAER